MDIDENAVGEIAVRPIHTTEAREFFVHLLVGAGGATLACKLRGGGDVVDVGVSFCAPGDQFSRPRGRRIASGRRVLVGRRNSVAAFTFRLEAVGADRPLRDRSIDAFRVWLAQLGGARPWWTIDAEEPRVEMRGKR
jgi:hypothetical protein